MEVPEESLKVFKCSKCEGLLSCSPVYVCADGGGLCSSCYSAAPPVAATRNTHYETAAKFLLFPCKNQVEGCKVKVPFNHASVHEEVCPKRKYVCPIVGSSACDWSGTAAQILRHCRKEHADRVLNNPTTLNHDITKSSSHTYLLQAFKLMFLLFTKVCVKSGIIYHSVRYLGSSIEIQNFKYTVNVTRDGETLVKKGKVAPQGCLAIQEDSSMILNINYLLGILGGFNDTTFTVALEQLMVIEKCSTPNCNFLLTVKDYRDSIGWKCEHCSPKKFLCKNNYRGCKYESSCLGKRNQHQSYFCSFAKYCFTCKKTVKDQLIRHHGKEHSQYCSGSTWQVSGRGSTRYLLCSEAGKIICTYHRQDSYFNLYINTPLLNDQLSNYQCIVQVINYIRGGGAFTTYTRTLNPSYTDDYDWYVKVKSEFFGCKDTFPINIALTKIK